MANEQQYGYPDPNQPQFPQSQPSASYPPQSQPSASYPQSQPSASYPPQGQQGNYGQQQPGYDPAQQQASFGQEPYQNQAAQAQAQYQAQAQDPAQAQGQGQGYGQLGTPGFGNQPASPENDLGAVFDFSFGRYATPAVAKIVYIIAIVVGVLYYLFGGIGLAATGASLPSFGGNPLLLPTIAWFVVGLGILALWIIGVRVVLELALANIRTSQNTEATLQALKGH